MIGRDVPCRPCISWTCGPGFNACEFQKPHSGLACLVGVTISMCSRTNFLISNKIGNIFLIFHIIISYQKRRSCKDIIIAPSLIPSLRLISSNPPKVQNFLPFIISSLHLSLSLSSSPSSLPSIKLKFTKKAKESLQQRPHQVIRVSYPDPHSRHRHRVDSVVRFRDVDEYFEDLDRFGGVGD